jgi:hypothetical protein
MRWIVLVVALATAMGRAEAQSGLTPEEWDLVRQGEIDQGLHITGGLLSVFVGFGTGQFVQGRSDKGLLFLVTDVAAASLFIVGLSTCWHDAYYDEGPYGGGDDSCQEWALIGGLVGAAVFRTWEIVDAWGGPSWHNDQVRRARARAFQPYVVPLGGGGGAAGFSLRF